MERTLHYLRIALSEWEKERERQWETGNKVTTMDTSVSGEGESKKLSFTKVSLTMGRAWLYACIWHIARTRGSKHGQQRASQSVSFMIVHIHLVSIIPNDKTFPKPYLLLYFSVDET